MVARNLPLLVLLSGSMFALVATTTAETAASSAAQTIEIPSVFFVSKSENRNQVHYALAVDQDCLPTGLAPLRAYWREYEKSPSARAPLLAREEAAYGIASQSANGNWLKVSLRALPSRTLEIQTARAADGSCQTWTHTTIAGTEAQLYQIHVSLWILGIASITLTGWTWTDRAVIREILKP
jgi:hypothetical protein